ncbi:amino acid/polyamine transporter I [Microdochium trichocladiopsis]|uniref:Amino acid/polyamine transporter I n=1 Tax=Microdochium trichocladiopsis TaxID=1682393 RepID=A0A9P9BQ92_9PEZI|nr:amino acid/polyamine transporter I [Microdochium trichocladiopsis]KAH7030603.1 amino acid/polyamine transporter I [Microdochium trichocladiopsis]
MANDIKTDLQPCESPIDGAESDGLDEKQGNSMDRANMYRMGKVQEMRRNFRFVSIFGFSMILMASWEAALSVAIIGLINGGSAGLIWGYFICWMGFILVNTSMAEMGSMAPTSGGQYHWASEFAPREHQKVISYLMGWLAVLGWQALAASTSFVAGTQIQGLLILAYPDTYGPEPYHGTLLSMALAAFSVFFNTVLSRKLPLIEGIVLIIHIFAFIGILVTLWVLAPLGDASVVFTEFTDGGGWGSAGASTIVGLLAGALPLLGADAAVHMSEELRDASRTLPKTMILSTIINGAMGWLMIITFCMCLGSLEDILASPTGQPFMQVFFNATQNAGSAIAMASFITALTVFCNITMVATASRQLFAFARDQAVPFSSFFAHIRPGWDVPANSIFFTFIVSSLLALINIGSPVALNSITSLSTTSLISTYIVSISCIIWRRATGAPMLKSPFTLGKWGLPINIASVVFLVFILVVAFMPSSPNPAPELMNWNILIYGVVMLISVAYFFAKGRHHYAGPVAYVRQLE